MADNNTQSLHYCYQGKVSIRCFHDTDGNGKPNKNFPGIPTEGRGFSKMQE
ncbi:MAG: DUF2141 domain-containing protein [Sulfuriferula sp.]